MVTQVQIAQHTGLDVSSVNKILNRREGPVFKKETVKQVFKAARALGFDFGRLKFSHRRRHERRPIDLAAEVSVRLADGTVVEEGRGILRDLSAGGASLGKLSLPSGTLPLVPFELVLRWKRGAKIEEARARVIRLELEGGCLAAEFLAPPARATDFLLGSRS